VFRASGHLEKFADTVIDCPACGAGNRGDHLVKNEWKRLLEGAQAVVEKAKQPHVMNEFVGGIEAIRDSADRDPNPGNLAALLKGEHALTREKLSREVGGFHVERTATTLTIARHGETKHLYEAPLRGRDIMPDLRQAPRGREGAHRRVQPHVQDERGPRRRPRRVHAA
jgi:hypothetical protein